MTDTLPSPSVEPVLTVQRAGAFLGLGRSASYDAVRRGEIPSLRIGRRIVVPTARLRALLGIDEPHDAGRSITNGDRDF